LPELCVIIHGFTGNPSEVVPLAHALKELGYEVVTPLLPGHNHTKARMQKVHASEWTDSIEEIITKAVKQNRVIHLIGFSMGAMLAASIAKRFPICTLTLLSPAVYVVTPNILLTRTKKTMKLLKEDRALWTGALMDNVRSMRQAPISNVVQFRKVVRNAKKIIPDIQVPVCIIHGLEDELVDPMSSDWIYQTVSSPEKELHHLPQSGHLICHSTESGILIETVVQFLRKHASQRETPPF
jgi:carboxylesterase